MKSVVSLTRRLVRMHMAFRPVALHISLGCRINLDGLLVIPEEVSGSSYPVPVITSPMCPCLHLRVKQQVLIWTNLSLITEITNRGVFLQENPVRAVKTTNVVNLSMNRICTMCCAQIGCPSNNWGFHIWREIKLSILVFLFLLSCNSVQF